jgi:acyl-CoA synthetase (AMP-forming)/AMP-acid ligase II
MAGLPFIDGIAPDRPALRDDVGGDWLTYGALADCAREWSLRMRGPRGLVLLYARNDKDSVAALLGSLAAGHAVALFDPKLMSEARAALEATYRPEWVVAPDADSPVYRSSDGPLHPDLAVLLSTSGSTGSAKLVRLTLAAMQANAESIAEVLHIGQDDVAAGYLPLHYSYGLSVLTSHLIRGACIRLTNMGLTDRAFWPAMREAGITHMPGVPFHHQIMLKLGLERLNLPGLRKLTQAGGALDPALRAQAHEFMAATGGQFNVLYGQTEAAPRMTTLQHDDFPLAPRSVGTALPGCRIEILDPDTEGRGEVVFYGPNVMLGYAESRDDLCRGDDMNGRLTTGDVGFLDAADRLTLTGRVKRMGKIFGLRVSLDEVEMLANTLGPAAVTQTGEALTVHIATTGDASADEALTHAILALLRERFTIPPAGYRTRIVDAILRTDRGKIDYPALEAQT